MKNGIPYFPLDCQLDDKFELIEAEFGLQGFSIVVKLLQRIYGGEGYYCEWTNEVALLFSKTVGLGVNAVSEIVNASIKRGIFIDTLFSKHGVLTSKGIQMRYFEAVSRRKSVEVKKQYLLVPADKLPKNAIILVENADINLKNADISRQRKGKKRKEEERKQQDLDELLCRVFTTYEKIFSAPTEEDCAKLQVLCGTFTPDVVIQAIHTAAGKGKSVNYVKGILNNWKSSGNIPAQEKEKSYDIEELEEMSKFNPMEDEP